MSSLLNMEFVQALNPLYAFPIVAVILCAFIVYAFGFNSPVQPPSFEGIEEERKNSKKRKTKESSKGKIVQNGKLNGSTSNKAQIVTSAKKKDVEKSVSMDKPIVEKSISEKKVTKKARLTNEKKLTQERKKESFSHEDMGEDGWVQLISKKGRKSRKKDELGTTENETVIAKPIKNSHINKSYENTLSEELPTKTDVFENQIPEKKVDMKADKEVLEVASVENNKDKIIIEEESKVYADRLEKIPSKENVLKNKKLNEETSNKSKKKKKNAEIVNKDNDCIISESPAVQEISEIPSPQNASNNTSVKADTPEIITGKVEEDQPKESKSSNVVFDELAGLYPEAKEQRKKKKVRRDH